MFANTFIAKLNEVVSSSVPAWFFETRVRRRMSIVMLVADSRIASVTLFGTSWVAGFVFRVGFAFAFACFWIVLEV